MDINSTSDYETDPFTVIEITRPISIDSTQLQLQSSIASRVPLAPNSPICQFPRAAKAMRLSLVLVKITKFLPFSDICNLRLTSKIWNVEFAREIKRISWLGFKDEGQPHRFVEVMKTSKFIPFSGYILEILDFEEIYFQFLQLVGTSDHWLRLSTRTSVEKFPIFKDFLYECSVNLTELTLKLFNSQPRALDQVFQPSTGTWAPLPQLRSILIDSCSANTDDVSEMALMAVDLIRGAARLEKLELYSNDAIGWLNSTVLVCMWNNLDTCGQLTSLSMSNTGSQNIKMLVDLSRRRDNPLALRNLLIRFRKQGVEDVGRQDVPFLLYEFLVEQTNTLEVLDVIAGSHGERIKLPYLGRLESLKWNLKWTSAISKGFPLGFALQNGLSLDCNFPCLQMVDFFLGRLQGHYQLTVQWETLKICLPAHPMWVVKVKPWIEAEAAAVANLHLTFPSVTNIEVVIYEDNFDWLRYIWKWPTKLTSLRIIVKLDPNPDPFHRGIGNIDELITGIPESQYNLLREAIANGTVTEWQAKLAELKTRAAITDLKELRTFVIETFNSTPQISVTEISDYFGFSAPGSELEFYRIEWKSRNLVRQFVN